MTAVLSAREASIFACLADTVLAPAPPLPPVTATDAVDAFDAWLARRARAQPHRRRARCCSRSSCSPASRAVPHRRWRALPPPQRLDTLKRRRAPRRPRARRRPARRRRRQLLRRPPCLRGARLHPRIPAPVTTAVDVCIVGSGAGGAPVARALAEAGARVAVLEDGRAFDRTSSPAPARHDRAAVPRRGPDRDRRDAADHAAARPRRRRHDARQLRHLLPRPGHVRSAGRAELGLDDARRLDAAYARSSANWTSAACRRSWPAPTR